jgi:hypothetical protein
MDNEGLITRLRKSAKFRELAEIMRSTPRVEPDRISDILEEAADMIECLRDDNERSNKRNKEIEVPVGWKLVPIEPTDEMLDATCVSQYGYINKTFKELADKHSNGIVEQIRDYLSGDYKAMLSASPEYKDKPCK